jgi:SAM-dependent methyltransferase
MTPREELAGSFDEFASLYDAVRPGYPPELIKDVISFARLPERARLLEVGAGTGKATMAFAGYQLEIVCVEPSPRMAAILKRQSAHLSNISVDIGRFEDWSPRGQFDLLVAAQSWHWIDPAIRLHKAAEVLHPGGTLALFWNQNPQPSEELAAAFNDAYRRHAPSLMEESAQPTEAFTPPATASGGRQIRFVDVAIRRYRSRFRYPAAEYLSLLKTYPAHHHLTRQAQSRLFAELELIIASFGGEVETEFGTVLHLARSIGP